MRSFLFSLLFIMKLHSWISMGHYIFKIVNFRSSSFILDKFDGELRELYMQLYIEELFFSKQFKELVQVNVCTVYCVLYYLILQKFINSAKTSKILIRLEINLSSEMGLHTAHCTIYFAKLCCNL